MKTTPRIRRSLIAGAVGLASLVGVAGVASADSPGGNDTHRDKSALFAQMGDEQRQCLTDAGLARPTGRPTVEQRQALRDAAEECGITVPDRGARGAGHAGRGGRFANLSDEQRQCLTDAGVTRPTGRPTVEQRQALRDAAADCGIEIPATAGR